MVQQHLKDGELGHVVGHAGFIGGGLGLIERQTRNAGFSTGFGQGVSTSWTGPRNSGHKWVEQGRKAKMGSAYRAPVHHRTRGQLLAFCPVRRTALVRGPRGRTPKDQPGHHGPYRWNRRPSSGYLIQNSVSKSALPWRSYIWHTREPLTGQSSESWAACVERPVDPCGRAEATVISLLLNVFRVTPRACSSQWRHSSQSTSRRTYSSPSLLGRNDARRANRKSGA